MRNRRTPIAVEGFHFILSAGLITLVLTSLTWKLPAALAFGVMLFIAFFFRNPWRKIPCVANAVVSPADGVIVYLGKAYEEHLGTEMLKISIFMSVLNVHVNRAPFSGRIIDIFHKSGKFLNARSETATFENEQGGIILETDSGLKFAIIQIAGLIARRIVSYPVKGDLLRRGERFGMICFGSRVDVYLPENIDLQVVAGDKTVAGTTILGYFREPAISSFA
jgi:phosphatidylserine decarboxylase